MVTFNCPRCGAEMLWQGEEDYEDIGIDGKGTVSFHICKRCGVEIECYISDKEEEKDDRTEEICNDGT